MPFLSQCGCIKDILVTEEELIDRFVGHELWAWGGGAFGRLGDSSIVNRSSPVQTISCGTNWRRVSLGNSTAAGIKTDGTLWVWGYGSRGGLGNNGTTSRSSPVQTISGGTNWKSVNSWGSSSTAAIKTDGTLWLWGCGNGGALGNNSTINRSSPVQTISGGTNWKSVSVGAGGAGGAIKTDGTLWMWGFGNAGQLGNQSTVNQSSPVQTIAGGNNWKSVSTDGRNTSAIKTDGTLWTWGFGSGGALGDLSAISKSSPVQTVSGGTNWRISFTSLNTAAIKTDGTLWLWGCGNGGALGNNSTANQSSPVQTVSGGNNWRSAATGSSSGTITNAIGIKTDGTLWTWGLNASGQLGTNSTIPRSSPVQTISGGTNWRSADMWNGATTALCVTEF